MQDKLFNNTPTQLMEDGYYSTYVNTSFEEESASGKSSMRVATKLLTNRTILLTGEVNDAMNFMFQMDMLHLVSESHDDIKIILNSPGGMVGEGLPIVDTILRCQEMGINVDIYCIGIAASMGSVILASGAKGHRFILPHAKVMIHNPYVGSGVGGTASSIQKTVESLQKTQRTVNTLLAKFTGKTLKQVEKATSFDNTMTAEEAIEFGLVDEIKCLF